MPAFVKSSVGSLAGKSGDERTGVCPCSSKYFKNALRISLPVIIESSLSRLVLSTDSTDSVNLLRNLWITKIELSRSPAQTGSPAAVNGRTSFWPERESLAGHGYADASQSPDRSTALPK